MTASVFGENGAYAETSVFAPVFGYGLANGNQLPRSALGTSATENTAKKHSVADSAANCALCLIQVTARLDDINTMTSANGITPIALSIYLSSEKYPYAQSI